MVFLEAGIQCTGIVRLTLIVWSCGLCPTMFWAGET